VISSKYITVRKVRIANFIDVQKCTNDRKFESSPEFFDEGKILIAVSFQSVKQKLILNQRVSTVNLRIE